MAIAEKQPVGRRAKLTEAQIDMALDQISRRVSTPVACAALLGVSTRSLYRAAERRGLKIAYLDQLYRVVPLNDFPAPVNGSDKSSSGHMA